MVSMQSTSKCPFLRDGSKLGDVFEGSSVARKSFEPSRVTQNILVYANSGHVKVVLWYMTEKTCWYTNKFALVPRVC